MNSAALVAVAAVLTAQVSGCARAPTSDSKPGTVFRDCPDCPEMVVVPAGSFTMGSPESEANRDKDEGPPHTVTIARPFAVSRFELTPAEYRAFIGQSGYDGGAACAVLAGDKMDLRSGTNWTNPGFVQTDRHPVVCVNWDDARAYLSWLSLKTGKTYRLLSEAEWEYAARAGTSTRFSFGSSPDELCLYANVRDLVAKDLVRAPTAANCRDGFGTTSAPVGSFKANAFGLYDMHGNVWEWVEDCFHDSYSGAPAYGTGWTAGDCAKRGIRGGSRGTRPEFVRVANRAFVPQGSRSSALGFRLARTLE
jgi:formylglycine-generating enzyme required for sulfatase activity